MTSPVTREAGGASESFPDALPVWCKPRPLSEWTEEDGNVLWWRFPIEEPPYCGTPNDLGYTVELHTHDSAKGPRIASRCSIGGWPGGHTHFTPIPMPWAPAAVEPATQPQEPTR